MSGFHEAALIRLGHPHGEEVQTLSSLMQRRQILAVQLTAGLAVLGVQLLAPLTTLSQQRCARTDDSTYQS